MRGGGKARGQGCEDYEGGPRGRCDHTRELQSATLPVLARLAMRFRCSTPRLRGRVGQAVGPRGPPPSASASLCRRRGSTPELAVAAASRQCDPCSLHHCCAASRGCRLPRGCAASAGCRLRPCDHARRSAQPRHSARHHPCRWPAAAEAGGLRRASSPRRSAPGSAKPACWDSRGRHAHENPRRGGGSSPCSGPSLSHTVCSTSSRVQPPRARRTRRACRSAVRACGDATS
mmetsp:Transcript_86002/g.191571  ORF Transcript_86002/g.191571 Transcript_86002/m.191571 type:complete len:232 (-) Transcript_86002:1296-1991(-)